MSDLSFGDDALREQFAGNYVAWRDGQVVLAAETYDELLDRMERLPIDSGTVVVEYIRRTDVVYIW